MNTVIKEISSMNMAEYNPRIQLTPDMEEYRKLAKSIKQFGLQQPVVWNKRTNNVVGGHQRITVAKGLGYTEVPAVVVDLPVAEEKLLNIALNRISGEWDLEKLKFAIEDIGVDNAELAGFSEAEILDIQNSMEEYLDDVTPDPKEEPKLYNVTLTFPKEKEGQVKQYVKAKTKDELVEKILRIMEEKRHA